MNAATLMPEVTAAWVPRRVRIAGKTAEIAGVTTYELVFDDRQENGYRFQAGQFNMLYLPGAGEIAISLSSDPTCEGPLGHTIRAAGLVTRRLSQLGPGATLGLRGPFGTPWPVAACRGAEVVLAAGGIGLAPLRSLVYQLVARRGDFGRVVLCYGARSPDTLLFQREFAAWRAAGIEVQLTVDRAEAESWSGHVGVVSRLVDRLRLADPARAVVLGCGPEVMLRYVVRSALGLGCASGRIWLSLERHMQCAIGHCGHCQLGPEFICRDGPVLPVDRVARWLQVEGL